MSLNGYDNTCKTTKVNTNSHSKDWDQIWSYSDPSMLALKRRAVG